jgi:hypothetical protein
LDEEIERQKIAARVDKSEVEEYTRVLKPSNTIEFDRCGEIVLYSAAPNADRSFWKQYPYVLTDQLALTSFLAFFFNPLGLSYYWN